MPLACLSQCLVKNDFLCEGVLGVKRSSLLLSSLMAELQRRFEKVEFPVGEHSQLTVLKNRI